MGYLAWTDIDRQVRWYGGRQVNLYVDNMHYEGSGVTEFREINVASRAHWWDEKPTLTDVDDFARQVLIDDSLWV